MRRGILGFAAVVLSFALSACTLGLDTGSIFSSKLATQPGTVNAGEAAALISAYRRSHGLGGVSIDPALMRIAATHSQRMAAANRMTHVLPGEGSFRQRLTAGGFNGGAAAENVAAGQKTLSDVLEAWRRSSGHNRNMLMRGVTHIGIAVAVAPESRYKTFWTLVLGAPRPATAEIMPGPGPFITIGGGAGAEVN